MAIVPLIIMTGLNYHHFRDAFHEETLRPVARFTTIAKVSLESFLSEHVSALTLVTQIESADELRDPRKLSSLLSRLKRSYRGFIDLGLIDSTGVQVSYIGP